MSDRNIFDQVRLTLPPDVHPDELVRLAPERWWRDKPRLACAYALRKSSRLNWSAYLERNIDIKNAGIDPILHFMDYGIYEGRKLVSWNRLKNDEKVGRPSVSVLIINYNNGPYLHKCISSVIEQTLKNIEIIIVDDGSYDNSRAIIDFYKQNDTRIKCIYHNSNESKFMADKHAVELATGRYLMWLDSDDYLDTSACEIMFSNIEKGFDIVVGGMEIINCSNESRAAIKRAISIYNGADNREYSQAESIYEIFIKRRMQWNLCGKIFLREICVDAYRELPEGYHVMSEDQYAFLAIIRRAKNLLKIGNKVYFYHFGIGISSSDTINKGLNRWFTLGDTVNKIGEYAKKYGMAIGFENIKRDFGHWSVYKWMSEVPVSEGYHYLDVLVKQFGWKFIINSLIDQSSEPDRMIMICEQIQSCFTNTAHKKNISKIGLYFSNMERVSEKALLSDYINLFNKLDIESILFVDGELPDSIDKTIASKVVYCKSRKLNHREGLESFGEMVKYYKPDILIYNTIYNRDIIWDSIQSHINNIPFIVYYLDDMLQHANVNDPRAAQIRSNILKCADAVICPSEIESLLLRLQGINCWTIPHPIKQRIGKSVLNKEIKNIAIFIGRNSVHSINEFFLLCEMIIKRSPHALINIICELQEKSRLNDLYNTIINRGLQRNIQVKNGATSYDQALMHCDILLNLSPHLPENRDIDEALARDKVCVSYGGSRTNLIKEDLGESRIINVPYGNLSKMADVLVTLLNCRSNTNKVSTKGIKYSDKLSVFQERLLLLLLNYDKLSLYHVTRINDIKEILSYLTYN